MKKISIRLARKEDFLKLLAFRNSSLFLKYCTERLNPVTSEEFELELNKDFERDRSYQFMIDVGEISVGTIWIYNQCPVSKSAFITTFISEDYMFRGYGVFAHCKVLEFMFDSCKLDYIFSDAYESNSLSIRTMKKRGWTQLKDYRKVRIKRKTSEIILRFVATLKNFKQHGQKFADRCEFINPSQIR